MLLGCGKQGEAKVMGTFGRQAEQVTVENL